MLVFPNMFLKNESSLQLYCTDETLKSSLEHAKIRFRSFKYKI